MPRICKYSSGKDSPLVKELFGLFESEEIPLNIKPAEYKKSQGTKYEQIDPTRWCNAFNKAKRMYKENTPPPEIGE